jgi:hypothetical protein
MRQYHSSCYTIFTYHDSSTIYPAIQYASIVNIGQTMVLIFVKGFRNFWLIVSNKGCHQIDDILTPIRNIEKYGIQLRTIPS